MVIAGMPNKQIAGELGTAERTVKAHRAQVMEKMQATSLADLVRASEQLSEGRNQQSAAGHSPSITPRAVAITDGLQQRRG